MKKIESKALLRVPVKMDFEFGRTDKPLAEVMELKKNSIIKLENSKKNIIQVYVNGSTYAEGKVLSKDGEIYVKITNLIHK